jgi:ATP-dependent protease ClpP protease subunit
MTADEAKEYGMIDKVLVREKSAASGENKSE